jgi:hypothetical protein
LGYGLTFTSTTPASAIMSKKLEITNLINL